MTFDEILAQVLALLQRQGRVSYRALKRRFDLDDDYIEDLKEEMLFAYPVVDEEGRIGVDRRSGKTTRIHVHPTCSTGSNTSNPTHSSRSSTPRTTSTRSRTPSTHRHVL